MDERVNGGVVVDAGHGGSDPGAISGNLKEKDFTLEAALYMYDRFIERLAVSKYRDNFILKGGFYLSTLFGLESRFTKDIDTAIKDANFTKENIEKMIKSIIKIDINDGALISFIEIGNIREEDQYGGIFEKCGIKRNIKVGCCLKGRRSLFTLLAAACES